jgi:hypothetical protein
MTNQVEVRHGSCITRGERLGFEHPNGEWELIEFYLPIDGQKQGWVNKRNLRPAPFKNLLGVQFNTSGRSFFSVEFVKSHRFNFHPLTPIDMFGYVYLSDEDQASFWEKFKDNK